MDKVKLPLELRSNSPQHAAKGYESTALISGVIYGQGKPAISVSAPRNIIDRMISDAGSNHVIEAVIDGKSYNVMLQDTQLDPRTNAVHHFDLLEIRMDQKIEADIPVHHVGELEIIEDDVILATLSDTVKVEALPANLPEAFEIDLSVLKEVGDSIKVGDIKSVNNVEIISDPEELLAKLEHKAEEVEEEPLDSEDDSEGADDDSEADGESDSDGSEEGEETASDSDSQEKTGEN